MFIAPLGTKKLHQGMLRLCEKKYIYFSMTFLLNFYQISNGYVLLSPLWRCIGRMVGIQKENTMLPADLMNLYQQQYLNPLPYQELGNFDLIN